MQINVLHNLEKVIASKVPSVLRTVYWRTSAVLKNRLVIIFVLSANLFSTKCVKYYL